MDFTLVSKTFDVLRIPPPPNLVLLEARTLSSAHVPPYPPDMPVLFTEVDSHELALHLKSVLLTTYPAEHVVQLVDRGKRRPEALEGKKEERFGELSSFDFSQSTFLFILPL